MKELLHLSSLYRVDLTHVPIIAMILIHLTVTFTLVVMAEGLLIVT